MKRHPVKKSKSAREFRNRAAKSHKLNFLRPMRGGIRL